MVRSRGRKSVPESNHFGQKKSLQGKNPGGLSVPGCEPAQVRYWIRNSEMPGKNNNSKVRMVSLIKKGMMPL